MNEQIALDEDTVKRLINAVGSCNKSVSMAACNAILDLFTTSIGRFKLLELSAINNLIFCFLQVPKSSTPSISLIIMEEVHDKTFFRIGFMEDEYPVLLLHVAITLINDCTIEQLRKVPRGLSRKFLLYLAMLWAEVHKHKLIETVPESERFFCLSNIRTNHLAESLFRLSMDETFTTPSKFQEVKRSIFHLGHISFESFIVNHWEQSPLLIQRPSEDVLHDNVFSSFSQFLRSKETVSSFLGFLLQNLTSALPINSDELDIVGFLKEARGNIGCPIIYQQDIRVVKTMDSKEEIHFFQGSSDSPYFLKEDDILRCEEAYNDGYTFALRGMEFHFKDIAAISEGMAFLFGQPSTGVNMYLTPPNSQGLARHRDDHCVLVCQIRGVKRWKIFPNPCARLPRLYEQVNDLFEFEGDNDMIDGCKEFLLREGDILYIPRGFPHEACTIIDDSATNGNSEFSLHLTLAIEIEPPFEWEGIFHVALHHWGQNYKFSNDIPYEPSSRDLHDVAVKLMHIAVKLIGDVDPIFRKACLVGAISFPSGAEGWIKTHQLSTFSHLLSRVSSDSNFNDVISNVERAISKNEDFFEKFRWVCHLDQKMSVMGMEDFFHLLIHQKDKVEATFMEVRSKFCNDVVFDDIVHHYNVLLEKYRTTRKQYMNGMLALNCI
ncbi:JmjC domain-containing protein [Artemisia annua]|uniref:Bifunctional lysine-specific demethylase and histidyl-hydroxylase n=1 Tax=Artemisia annua TaxID=35608 RepID=A0A2U1Q1C2_ARTAN|nr:JmjC domain-containing protein [Artemisia annua]